MPTFSQTVSKVARDAEVASATVRMYENLGLIPCVRTTNGVRLSLRTLQNWYAASTPSA